MKLAESIILGWWHAGGGYEKFLTITKEQIKKVYDEGVKYENCSDPKLKLFLIACHYMKPWEEPNYELSKDIFTTGLNRDPEDYVQCGYIGWSNFDIELEGGWNNPQNYGEYTFRDKRLTAKAMIDAFEQAQAWKSQNLPAHIVP